MKKSEISNQVASNAELPEEAVSELSFAECRREALKKIGKFTAYAAPAGVAILGSKAAHAS